MIPFFRNIRQKLIKQEKIRKYFFYALGEILLVVIGILLALQVNNWNEQRKAEEYERALLIELQKAVHDDIDFFEDHLLNNRNVFKREIHQYFKQMILGEEVDETKFNRYFEWLRYGNTFHVNDGAYESIKSSGINKISNKEIRNYITRFYEFNLPRFKELIEYSLVGLNVAREEDLPKLLGDPVLNLEDEFSIEENPISFDVKTNPHFLKLLERSINWEKNSTRFYRDMLTMYHELDSMLVMELSDGDLD